MRPTQKRIEQLVVPPSLLFGAVVIIDQVFYRNAIVPRLGEWSSVPVPWWLACSAFFVTLGLIAGARVTSRTLLVVSAALAAVATQVYLWGAAISHQPGHAKSLAIEAPRYFWSAQLLLVACLYLAVLAVGFLFFRRRSRHAA